MLTLHPGPGQRGPHLVERREGSWLYAINAQGEILTLTGVDHLALAIGGQGEGGGEHFRRSL